MLKTFGFDLRHDLIVHRFLRSDRDGHGNHEWRSQQGARKKIRATSTANFARPYNRSPLVREPRRNASRRS
jgi:hypothetical protein